MQPPKPPSRSSNNAPLYIGLGIGLACLLVFLACGGVLFVGAVSGFKRGYERARRRVEAADADANKWRIVDASRWGFEVEMPGAVEFRPRTTPEGNQTMATFVESQDQVFMIMIMEFDLEGLSFAGFVNELTRNTLNDGERIVFEQLVDVPGAIGCKEVHYIDTADDMVKARYVVTDQHLIQVVWSAARSDGSSPRAERFLHSFRVLPQSSNKTP